MMAVQEMVRVGRVFLKARSRSRSGMKRLRNRLRDYCDLVILLILSPAMS